MTAESLDPRLSVAGPRVPAGPRPTTVITVLVMVLAHAALALTGIVTSAFGLASFVLTHPGFGWNLSLVLPVLFGAVLSLVVATLDVVLVLRFFSAARRARVVLSVWLGLAAAISLGGLVIMLSRNVTPTGPALALSVAGVGLCVGAVLLMWVAPTSAWLRDRSERS